MSFDYRKEFARFMSEWEKQETAMRTDNMSEESISELYDLYFEQFKGNRNYALHKYDFTQVDDEENLPDENTKKQGMITQPLEFEQCFDLLEQVESLELLEALKRLKPSDYELLCLFAVQGLTEREIALKFGQTQQSISKKLVRVKKYLKNIF